MTVKEAAVRWSLCEGTIRKYCINDQIADAHKVSNRWIIPDSAINPNELKRIIPKDKVIDFNANWDKTSKAYKSIFPKRHIAYPDSIQKWVIINFFDPSLKPGKKPYDFEGNIELKSTTTKNGQSHFSKTQKDCKRIIHFSIVDNQIKIVELSIADVKKINKRVSAKSFSTCLDDYHSKSTKIVKLNLLTLEIII